MSSFEQRSEDDILSVAYSYPYIRYMAINEIRDHIEANASTVHVAAQAMLDDIIETNLISHMPMRTIQSDYGNLVLMLTTKNDTLLIGESINTPMGNIYKPDSLLYEVQARLNDAQAKKFVEYLAYYVQVRMKELDPLTYEALCFIFECDQVIGIPEIRTIEGHPVQVNKLALSFGFVNNDKKEPRYSKYCLTPALQE